MRLILLFISFSLFADLSSNIEANKTKFENIALKIWDFADSEPYPRFLDTKSNHNCNHNSSYNYHIH